MQSGHMVDQWLSANLVIMHNSLPGGTFINPSYILHFLAKREQEVRDRKQVSEKDC